MRLIALLPHCLRFIVAFGSFAVAFALPLAAQQSSINTAAAAVGSGLAQGLAAERALLLVHQMTLEEKVSQLQNESAPISRLKIPAYDWWNEALHGVARSGHATVFPQAIGMAATWDRPLMERVGSTIAIEARAKFNQAQREGNRSIYFGLTMWSPNINVDRDPRWGRGQETYGEDPFLTGSLGVAFVRGLEGANPQQPMVDATAKHFAVHSGPEAARHNFNAAVSPYDLHDTYLPAFRQLVVDAHVNAVMCAYNAVDGAPACASPALLQNTLRRDWGFAGYVVSDCAAISDVNGGHHFAADRAHAAAVSLRAGTDLSCGKEYAALTDAVHLGLVRESEIDAALIRLLAARIRLGLLKEIEASNAANKDASNEAIDPRAAIPFSQNNSAAHAQLALEGARKSIVLLSNKGSVLPFAKSVRTLAVIGPNARSLATLEGNYNAIPSQPSFPLEALEARAHVLYAQGSSLVEGFPVPVPATLFSPVDPTLSGQTSAAFPQPRQGLNAEYFATDSLAAKPQVVRVDRAIDFDWNAASPDASIPIAAFAARWTGWLTAPAAGTISFGFNMAHCSTCEDAESIHVWLDGKQVYEFKRQPTHGRRAPTPRFDLTLADVKPHALRIEYTHRAPHFGAGLTMNWIPPAEALRTQAVRAAEQADVVVAFLGLSPELEGEEMPIHVAGFEGGDRTAIELPKVQAELVEALAATHKPLVLVLMSGSALALEKTANKADAILEAWYPGQAGGEAIAETLFGQNNPSGRLPITFYASTEQLPEFSNYSMQGRTYRYFSGSPLYPFGYGLSYASFQYTNAQLSTPTLQAGSALLLTVDVKNTASLDGDEVVQCYLTAKNRLHAPLRKLVAYERIALKAGETRTVQLQMDARQLSLVDEQGQRAVEPGDYELSVGGGQPQAASTLTLSLRVEGRKPLEP